MINNKENENLDTGTAYSNTFPGTTLDFELMLTNAIEIQTKTLELFRDSLNNKGFDKNISDLMTVLYFSSTLNVGSDKK
jgi:hypothetical protein